MQFWGQWIIFSAFNEKVLAYTYKNRGRKIKSDSPTPRFEFLDPNDDPANAEAACDEVLPFGFDYQGGAKGQALGIVRDILIGQNYAYVCGTTAGSNIWRWCKTGDISSWSTLDDNSVPLVTADAPGFLPFRNASNLNAQAIFRGNLYVFSDDSVYRISRTNAVDPVTKVPISFTASLISNEAGCLGRNSLVTTRLGIFFPSRAGIYVFDGSNILNLSRGKVQKLFQERFTNLEIVYSVHWAYLNTVIFFHENIGLAYNYGNNSWSLLSFGLSSQFNSLVALYKKPDTPTKHYIKEVLYNESLITNVNNQIVAERAPFGNFAFGKPPFGGNISPTLKDKNIVRHEALFETHNKTFGNEASKNLRYIRSVGGAASYIAKTENTNNFISGENSLLTGKVFRVRGSIRTSSLSDVVLIGLVKRSGRFDISGNPVSEPLNL